ncbi:MAG TPA: hypothetical protein VFZ41_05970 [Solirubrobacterales bacterium]
MAAWKLPLIVAAIALPIVAGFLLAGPALGTALGAVAAVTILLIAASQRPRGPLGELPSDGRRHVLLVVTCTVEEPGAVSAVAREAELEGQDREVEVRVLSPASIGFLDRWATDVAGARQAAQERLVTTVAALARSGIEAEARVGDEDVVQAVEDQLQSYPADRVVLVSTRAEEDGGEDRAAAELSARLRADFRHLVLNP